MRQLRDILVRLGAEGIVRLCGLASFPVLARMLGADGYGVVVGTGAVAGLAMSAGGLGLSFHVGRLIQHSAPEQQARLLRSLLVITLLTGFVLAAGVAVGAAWLGQLFMPHPAAAPALVAAAAGIVCGAGDGVLGEWLRARHRFGTISALQSGQALVQLAGILLVVASGGGVVAVVATVTATQVLKAVLVFGLLRRAGEFASPGLLPRAELARLVVASFPVLTATFGAWTLSQGVRLVVGNRLDAAAIGAFAAAAVIASGLGMIGSACWLPLYPRLTRSVAHAHPGMATLACRGFGRFFHQAAIPALALGAALGGTAIHCLGGGVFPGVALTCALLLTAAYVEMASLPWSYIAGAHGDAAGTRNAILAGGTVNLATALVLCPLIGIAGAGTAVLVGQAVTAGLNARLVHRLGHAPLAALPWPAMAAALLATLPALLAALVLLRPSWSGLLLAAGAGALTYAAVLALIHRLRMLRQKPS